MNKLIHKLKNWHPTKIDILFLLIGISIFIAGTFIGLRLALLIRGIT